ncbi:hypothetical protein CG007_03370 [Mesoplasma entomophilum]|uniref:Uncharacterized protein n=1 Tax=Mesoplasma entomophilum TaxID=2149 RepID=A0A3S5XZW7_9MOLU|nr:hypothetical protein [Mesoplasma entomophilum]ATQ35808.1 hypothetical protein CS528_03540 [Mesoplasma entomophilum]ATZ19779.1 hypothetical protein MENTO_v1c06780 [Mesoplasma entomophilum]AVN60625.1 hypothetical protein CG007_03370 [Mesoplasma entomophilum]
MSSIKLKHFINDISDYFEYDENLSILNLVKEISYEDINFNLTYYIDENKNLNIDSIDQLCQKEFPFIQSPSTKVLEQIFLRNKIAKELIINSVIQRKSESLKFEKNNEDHKIAINIAKSVVHDLNKFIYKNKINHSVANILLANVQKDINYYGKIDLLLKSNDNWFLCIFKFSKSPYEDKYKYEAQLQKKLIENNSNIKNLKVFIFNPLADIVVKELNLQK